MVLYIRHIEFAHWAAPIVPIVKADGSIKICGDYKLTVNRAVKTDSYPSPVLRICLYLSLEDSYFLN